MNIRLAFCRNMSSNFTCCQNIRFFIRPESCMEDKNIRANYLILGTLITNKHNGNKVTIYNSCFGGSRALS